MVIGFSRTRLKDTAGTGKGYSRTRVSDTAGSGYWLQQDLGKGYSWTGIGYSRSSI
jgi:hypothetical protein